MPNEVNENRNTIDDAARSAGRSIGSVVVRKARTGPAPSVRAASVGRPSRVDHAAPTVRTTTA